MLTVLPATQISTEDESHRSSSIIRKIHPLLWLLMAISPVIAWYVKRLDDGGDEPLGLLTFSLALMLAWRDRKCLDASSEARICGAMMVLASAMAIVWLPPMLRAGLAVSGVAVFFGIHQRAGLMGLLALSLPVVASLQFFAGYPLRVATAEGAVRLLEMGRVVVSRTGAQMEIGGRIVGVDPACSGVRMLWHALAAAMALAALHRVSWRATSVMGLLAIILVIPANILRAFLLVFEQTGFWEKSDLLHGGIGLASFAIILAPLLWIAVKRAGRTDRNVCITTKRVGGTDRNVCITTKRAGGTDRNVCITTKRAGGTDRNVCITTKRAGRRDRNVCITTKRVGGTDRNVCITTKRVGGTNRNVCITTAVVTPFVTTLLIVAAILAPLLAIGTPRTPLQSEIGPEPVSFTFDGLTLPLRPLRSTEAEMAFAKSFPGTLSSHRWGDDQVILRRMTEATRRLHPSRDCLRAAGFETTDAITVTRPGGGEWASFSAGRDGEWLLVYERIVSERDGAAWTDVSAWYWSAMRHPLNGPWRAETVISRR